MLCRGQPGAVAVSIVEALKPVTSLVQGCGTSDCRYEHELQIRFSPRSLPGGSISVIINRQEGDKANRSFHSSQHGRRPTREI